jgi:hypothetical protein
MFVMSICLVMAGLVGAQSSFAKTTSCSAPKYPGSGYFTPPVKATNVTCASARKLVLAYYKCRIKAGGKKGTCTNRTVNGLKCKEYRPASGTIPTQFNARVTCTKGAKKVVHNYQQNIGE